MIIFILEKAALLFRQEGPLFRVRFLRSSRQVLFRNLMPARLGMHEINSGRSSQVMDLWGSFELSQ